MSWIDACHHQHRHRALHQRSHHRLHFQPPYCPTCITHCYHHSFHFQPPYCPTRTTHLKFKVAFFTSLWLIIFKSCLQSDVVIYEHVNHSYVLTYLFSAISLLECMTSHSLLIKLTCLKIFLQPFTNFVCYSNFLQVARKEIRAKQLN